MSQAKRQVFKNRMLRPSLRVPRNRGETAIHLLAEAGVLDRAFNINDERQILMLPLVRRLKPSELDTLHQEIADATFGEDEFEPRRVLPRTLEEALSDQIPSALISELPRSYDIVGDIAILELGHDLVPYEKRVAEAILRVQRNVRSVFAKAGQISGVERVRPLRHIAGNSTTETVHREFGCSFKVDLSKVFFSPRLSTEHMRVAEQVVEGEHVVDMFAGAGPFSILIAKRVENVTVDAIDSNLAAVRLIAENAKANKVASKVRASHGDATDVVGEQLLQIATRVIMNHPSASRQFVDVAYDALQPSGGIVHYYTFQEGEDSERKARDELEVALKRSRRATVKVLRTKKVREVAPMKWQIAVDASIVPERS